MIPLQISHRLQIGNVLGPEAAATPGLLDQAHT